MDDNEFDALIDEVARDMTAGEPQSAFRAQVLARLDAAAVTRDIGFGWWRGAVASLAVAAAVIVAVLFFRGQAGPPATTEIQVAQAPDVPPARAEIASGPSRPPSLAPRQVVGQPVRPRVESRDEVTSDVVAMAPPPLAVASIAIAALPTPDSIQLDELQTIAPIAIAPIGPDDQGERR